ncbi:MAG: hypothetical protein QM764_06770 [Chitinophagaceae bacterium]
MNPENTIAISINFFKQSPDIPTIKDVGILRTFYRNLISDVNGGLIEVELFQKEKIDFIRTIIKFRSENSGMTYIGSLTLPFKNCSFVFKVQAIESGATGMRETIIANRLLSAKNISVAENGYSNWSADPYDATIKNDILMNKSEQSIYDVDFPSHPLTQVRKIINQIEIGMKWSFEPNALSAFDK